MRRWRLFISTVVMAAWCAGGRAAEPNQAEIQAWVDSLVHLAADKSLGQPCFLEWELEVAPRQETAATPFKGKRAIWSGPQGARISSTPGEGRVWTDVTSTTSASWSMTPGGLVTQNPAAETPNRAFSVSTGAGLEEAQWQLAGGLQRAGYLGVEMRVTSVAGPNWIAEGAFDGAESGQTLRVRADGDWDEVRKAGRVAHVVVTKGKGGAAVNVEVLSSGWTWNEELGRYVVGSSRESVDGRDLRSVRHIAGRAIDDRTFAEATAIPAFDGTDVYRGPVTFTVVEDATERLFTNKTPQGLVSVSERETPAGMAESTMRTVGWVIAGVLGVALVIIRVRGSGGR